MPNQSDPNQVAADATNVALPPTVQHTDLPPLPDFMSVPTPPVSSTPVDPITPPTTTPITSPFDLPPVISANPKKKFGGGKIIATILGLFLLVGGLGAGLVLTQQSQIFNQKAACTNYCPSRCSNGCTFSGPNCGFYCKPAPANPTSAPTGAPTSAPTSVPGVCSVCKCCNSSGVQIGSACITYSCSTYCGGAGNVCGAAPAPTASPTAAPTQSPTPGGKCCPKNDSLSAQRTCPGLTPANSCTFQSVCYWEPSGACQPQGPSPGPTESPGACVPSTSLNTYGKGYKGTVPQGTYGCPKAVPFNCAPNEEANLGRHSDCSCYAQCTVVPTDCNHEPANNCSQNTGSCWVKTNIGVALDGCPCNAAHYTTCASGYRCDTTAQDCVLSATPTPPPGGPTAPPGPTAVCVAIKVYDTNWNQLTATQLSALTVGTVIRLAVSGTTTSGTIDKAQFTVNGTALPVTTTKHSSDTTSVGEFYSDYTIPSVIPSDTGAATFTITAKLHHTVLDWF